MKNKLIYELNYYDYEKGVNTTMECEKHEFNTPEDLLNVYNHYQFDSDDTDWIFDYWYDSDTDNFGDTGIITVTLTAVFDNDKSFEDDEIIIAKNEIDLEEWEEKY